MAGGTPIVGIWKDGQARVNKNEGKAGEGWGWAMTAGDGQWLPGMGNNG